MAAGDEQREERIRRRLVALEERGEEVAVQMVDRVERQAGRERERFRRGDADDEAADESRPGRDGDAVELAERDAGARQRVVDRRGEQRGVPAGGDLGHDPAVLRVELVLVGRDVREHAHAVAHDGGRGVVARRLDPEQQHLRSDS